MPLPFEVNLSDNAQRYPALNIRSGTQEEATDNDSDRFNQHLQSNFPRRSQVSPRFRQRSNRNRGEPMSGVVGHQPRLSEDSLNQQDFDKWLNPHLYPQENYQTDEHDNQQVNRSDYDGQVNENASYNHHSDTWRSREVNLRPVYDAIIDSQPRLKKQAPNFTRHHHEYDSLYDSQMYEYTEDLYDVQQEEFDRSPSFMDLERNASEPHTQSLSNSTEELQPSNSFIIHRHPEQGYNHRIVHRGDEQSSQTSQSQSSPSSYPNPIHLTHPSYHRPIPEDTNDYPTSDYKNHHQHNGHHRHHHRAHRRHPRGPHRRGRHHHNHQPLPFDDPVTETSDYPDTSSSPSPQ